MGKNSDKKRRQKEHRRLEERPPLGLPADADQDAKPTSSTPPLGRTRDSTQAAPTRSTPVSSPFAPRKRQVTPVSFVYPRQTHQSSDSTPYTFGSFLRRSAGDAAAAAADEGRSAETVSVSRTENGKGPSQCKRESIDDILFGPSPQRRNTTVSPTDDPVSTAADEQPSAQPLTRSEPTVQTPAASSKQPVSSSTTNKNNNNRPQNHKDSPPISLPSNPITVDDAVRDKQGLRPRANSTDGELMLPQRGLCDERQILEAFQWKRDHQFKGSPKGLLNLGNTCFLNSTLQCLAFLPPLCQSLLALPNDTSSPHRSGNSNSPRNHRPNQGKRVTLILQSLFRRMHDPSSLGAIAPKAMVQAVPLLSSIGCGRGYKFRPGRQEDAHEFLVHLLDAMNDGELKQAGIHQQVSGWRDRLPVARLDETTLLRRIFGGYFRNEVTCTQCGKKSKTYDPFLDLSLEVSRKNCNSLADAIREFTRKETLDSANRWKCPGCQKRVCAVKQLTVFRPPLALCIQLKRFAFSGGISFGGSGFKPRFGGGMKVTKPVEFPAHLELPLSDGRSCGYALTGVVIHVGSSASSGHYTAYIKKPGDDRGTGKWYHMDDSYVQAVSETTVLRQRDAYVLFYCRREVQLQYPSPPLSMSAEEATKLGRARAKARAESIDQTLTAQEKRKETPVQTETPANESENHEMVGPSPNPEASIDTKLPSQSINQVPSSNLRKNEHKYANDSDEESSEESSHSDEERRECFESQHLLTTNGKVVGEVTGAVSKDSVLPRTHQGKGSAKPEQDGKAPPVQSSKTNQTRIVVDRGAGREKIEVMIGPRRKSKAWKPASVGFSVNDDQFGLLGNQRVNGWNEETVNDEKAAKEARERQQVLNSIKKVETKRKREEFLDSWDASLDMGKTKKVKARKEPVTPTDPKNNIFQKIQSDVLSMFGRRNNTFHKTQKKNHKKHKR